LPLEGATEGADGMAGKVTTCVLPAMMVSGGEENEEEGEE